LLPELRELNPQVERAIVETSGLLSDEMEVLERAVDEAVGRLGDRAVALGELREEPRGLARMILRRMAETASRDAGANVAQSSLSRDDADAILALGGAQNGGSVSLDLGGGLRAVCEYGILRFTYSTDPPPPAPVSLPVPGTVRFGDWEVEARSDTAGDALVSADKLADILTVRSWVSGDRMRPAGLGGSKSLQDLFTDRKVPRALRRTLPVVESEGEIVWVAGVSVDERFVIASDGPEHGNVIALVARRLNR
jgi:tRNA(Ile)-lysidine synthase